MSSVSKDFIQQQFSEYTREELIQELIRLKETEHNPDLSTPTNHSQNTGLFPDVSFEDFFRNLSEKIGEAIIILNGQKIADSNAMCRELLQYAKQEILGKSIPDFLFNHTTDDQNSKIKWDAFLEKTETGETMKGQWVFIKKTGEPLEAEVTLFNIEANNRKYKILVIKDISERIRLRRSLKLMTEEQMLARSGSWSIEVESGRTTWSDSLFLLHGLPIDRQAPSLSQYLRLFVHPDDRTALYDKIKGAINSGESFNIDLRVILSGNILRYFHLSCNIQHDYLHKPKYILGICLDVTERKKLELQLFESKEGYKKLVEHLPEGVIIYKPERVLYANRSAMEICGIPTDTNISEVSISIFEFILPQYHEEIIEKIQSIGETGSIGPVEIKISNGKGQNLDIEARSLLVNYKGETCIQSIFSDISYRKTVEQSLLERERQLTTLISNLPGMAFRCKNDGRWTMEFVSDGCLLISGFEATEIVGNSDISFVDLIHAEDKQYVWDTVQIALKSHRSYVLNYRLVHRNGNIKWIYEQGKGVYSSSGKLVAIEGFITDVSRQKQAEQELMVSRENYKNLVDFLPDGIIIHLHGKIKFINPGVQRILKLTSMDNAIGKNILDFVAPQFRHVMIQRTESAHQGFEQLPEEMQFVDSSGNLMDVELRSRPFFFRGSEAVLEFIHDLSSEKQLLREQYRARIAEETNLRLKEEISKRQKVQLDLEQSRRYIKNILNSSVDMIIANDGQGLITEFNDAACKTFGYSTQEALGLMASKLYCTREDYDRVREGINKTGVFEGEIVNIDRYGRKFSSFLTASGLFDETGQLIGGMGVSRDITQIKADQEKLRNSEEQYKALFNQALIGITRMAPDGSFLKVNEHFSKITGFSAEELYSMNRIHLLHPDDLEHLDKQFSALLEGKMHQVETQKRIIRKDGSVMDVMTNLSVVKNAAGHPDYLVAVYEDITERLKAQQALFEEKAKLNAILESSTHLVFSADRDSRLVSFNHNTSLLFELVYGVTPFTGLQLDSQEMFTTTERNELWKSKVSEALSGEMVFFESDFVDKNGHQSFWEFFLSPVKNNDGSITEVAGVGHNLTERKKVEKEAGNQAAKLNAIFQSSSQQIYTVNKHRELTSFNEVYEKTALRDFGRKPELGIDIRKGVYEFFSPEEADVYIEFQDKAFAGLPQQYEYKRRATDDNVYYYQVYLDPIVLGNQSIEEVSYLVHDITERKLAQRKIVASLKEKEILLKEVHHRVKNNLQVISSILNLQKSYLKDESMGDILGEIQNRIISMAFVHENLYRARDFSTIDLNGYVSDLLSHIAQSFHQDHIRLQPDLLEENIPLSLDQAIPCGLIINELVSNSFKYGFPNRKNGVIKVSVRENKPQIEITVRDNGVGFPKDFIFEMSQTLGLQLVTSLVNQLDGTIQQTQTKGVGFKIKFKIK